ncbi:MAG: DinB family protein [Bacteroidota bacterium]
MKQFLPLIAIAILFFCCSEDKTKSELKAQLIKQLKHVHTDQNWFVPTKIAIEGITAEQSNWKDSSQNHSIGELVSHITFWSKINLRALKGEDKLNFKVDNETTFDAFTENEWNNLVHQLDSIQTEWINVIEKAEDEQLTEWGSEITNMAMHNAYHTGQIIYIRKRNGWWKPK